MIFLVVSSLFLGLFAVGPAHAQGQAPHPLTVPNEAGGEVMAVNACVKQIRQLQPGERFDAYVGLNGQVRPAGSETAIARFRLCLQQAGYPMQ